MGSIRLLVIPMGYIKRIQPDGATCIDVFCGVVSMALNTGIRI